MNLQVGNERHVLGVIEVDNPAEFAERVIHPKVKAVRELRDDPLGQMHDRHQISHSQYQAGRQWQRDYEAAGPRVKSSGHLQEPVDGSRPPAAGITDRQMIARERLIFYRELLGKKQYRVIEAVLADKLTMWGVVCRIYPEKMGPPGRRFAGQLFGDLLTQLARAMGLQSGG